VVVVMMVNVMVGVVVVVTAVHVARDPAVVLVTRRARRIVVSESGCD
jgi:hypothetical protein